MKLSEVTGQAPQKLKLSQVTGQAPETREARYARLQKQAAADPQQFGAEAEFQAMPRWQQMLAGAGAEGVAMGRGIAQFVTPNDSAVHQQLTSAADEDARYQDATSTTGAGIAGHVLPYLATIPLGGPEAAALRLAPEAGTAARVGIKVATAAAEGGAYGGAREVRTGDSRVGNTEFGAGAGILARGVQGGASKLISAAKGEWVDPALKVAHDYAIKNGIPVTLGDLGSRTAQFFENRTKGMYGSGRRAVMEQQQSGVEQQAAHLRDGFRADREQAAGMAGLTQEDPATLVAGGIHRQYQTNRQAASALYNNVDALAQKSGAGPVVASNTQQALNGALTDAPEVLSGFGSGNRSVMDWLTSGGKPHLSFGELRDLRKEVANAASLAQKRIVTGNATTATQTEAHQLGRIQRAIEVDLQDWANKGGKVVSDAYKNANQFFRENVVPYRTQPETRPFIQPNANPDKISGRLQPTKPETARRIMDATDQPGRAAARELYVNRGFEKASDPAMLDFSINKLLRGINPGASADAMFTPAQQRAIAKVGDLAQLVRRSAGAKADPMTGQLLVAGVPAALGATYGDDLPGGKITGAALGLLAPRGVNTATKSAIVKRLVMAGLPKGEAESVLRQLVLRASQRGSLNGFAQLHSASNPVPYRSDAVVSAR